MDSGEHRSFGIPADRGEKEKEKRSISIESLDNYAREHWEVSLRYLGRGSFFLTSRVFYDRQFFILWCRLAQAKPLQDHPKGFYISYNGVV